MLKEWKHKKERECDCECTTNEAQGHSASCLQHMFVCALVRELYCNARVSPADLNGFSQVTALKFGEEAKGSGTHIGGTLWTVERKKERKKKKKKKKRRRKERKRRERKRQRRQKNKSKKERKEKEKERKEKRKKKRSKQERESTNEIDREG